MLSCLCLQHKPAMLARRFRLMALVNLLVSPFLMAFLIIHFFMRNAEKFYHHPRCELQPTVVMIAWRYSAIDVEVHVGVRKALPSCGSYGKPVFASHSSVAARSWSPYAKWRIREFNEMRHLLDHRLSASRAASTAYISQFPTPVVRQVGAPVTSSRLAPAHVD